MAADDTNDILNEMISQGISLEPMIYMAYVYGPPEWWPEDTEKALPGVLKKVSESDLIGQIAGSA